MQRTQSCVFLNKMKKGRVITFFSQKSKVWTDIGSWDRHTWWRSNYKLYHFYLIDDHCQYWLNKADGILRSPNFGANDKLDYYYDCNLNCTWILDTDQEYYITLELDYFMVIYSKDTLHFHNFSNKVYHSSFTWVTISQYMTDQISNHDKYQN